MAGEAVLVVDDNPQNLKLASLILRHAGYVVHTAVDAETALEQLRSIAPLVILMDLQLPGMSGLALTRMLKADPARRHIGIVALTAYAMKGDEEKARQAGCDGYITKPLDRAALLREVGEHVARVAAALGSPA